MDLYHRMENKLTINLFITDTSSKDENRKMKNQKLVKNYKQ